MRLRAEMYYQALESGLVYTVNHPVKRAGAYQLRVALRDATSEKVGSASQFIEVPDVSKGRLLLSGIVLRADVLPESAIPTAAPPANAAEPVPVEGAQTQEIDPKGTPAVRIFKPGKTMIHLQVVVTDKLARRAATQSIDFSVE